MKTYLGIIEDHSGSMQSVAKAAARDYNTTLQAAQVAAAQHNIQTLVTTIECGGGWAFREREVPIETMRLIPENAYATPGRDTPLFQSVDGMIDRLLDLPDASDPEVTFVIMATTDGQDNVSSGVFRTHVVKRIRELQNTDRWTVVFRVPKGDAAGLVRMGIEPGNILEWETTTRGLETAATQNAAAVSDFFAGRAVGTRSTRTFYTSVANITEADVKKLGDISSQVQLFPISAQENGKQIRDFVESRLGGQPMLKGAAFYQLVKVEEAIQDYKLIAIRDKETGQIYCGPEARDLIGLPRVGNARVRPDTVGKWQVFVQSTSVNRKVTGNTSLMYWPQVGKSFTEGKSAR